jgi:hypothetical protein
MIEVFDLVRGLHRVEASAHRLADRVKGVGDEGGCIGRLIAGWLIENFREKRHDMLLLAVRSGMDRSPQREPMRIGKRDGEAIENIGTA